MRITFLKLLKNLDEELRLLEDALEKKAKDFDHIVKIGRTHLMDAAPIRLGQVFLGYAFVIKKARRRLERASERLLSVNIGATAVGTGINTDLRYIKLVIKRLSKLTGFKLCMADNYVEITQSMADFVQVSSALRELALELTKILNDIRLMASGPVGGLGELILPAVQPGSSIMPGKVNPVIAEAMNMVCYQVLGNDFTVALAAQAGQLELNVMMPVIAHNIIQSIVILTNGLRMMRERMVVGILADEQRCKSVLERSPGIALALSPFLGFEKTAEVVKRAVKEGKSIREVVLETGLMEAGLLDRILDPYSLTEMKAKKSE
ncbi:MAG: lyase family protein [Nitrososphaerota archaeon]